MTRRVPLCLLVGLLVALAAGLAPELRTAAAQPEPAPTSSAQAEPPAWDAPSPPPPQRGPLVVEARPIFGDGSLTSGGWGELLVRLTNGGSARAAGEVRAEGDTWSGGRTTQSRAPYVVAPGASVSLRLPLRITEQAEPRVRVLDAAGRELFQQAWRRAPDGQALLVDMSQSSPLGAAVRGIYVAARNNPWAPNWGSVRGYGGHVPAAVEVASPSYDPTTGDAAMPTRTAGYAQVAALVARSNELVRLGPTELEALTTWLLGGGTLALVVTRPEDLRDALLVSLLGAEPKPGPVSPVVLAELVLPAAPGVSGGAMSAVGSKPVPVGARPEPDLERLLVSHSGGNLRPSSYGASAPYGLGEVHLLAFDPTAKPAVDSPWAQVRVVDLVRRAVERRSSVLFRAGAMHELSEPVRRQLDPNEGSRWAIVLTALLLFAYAVAAGPVNFGVWRKRSKPLQALAVLPLLSAATIGAVVGIGLVAKGCTGRARHLTLVEAGAGHTVGTARRWRGFYVPTTHELVVASRHASSVVSTARMDFDDQAADRLRVDRDGTRLEELSLRPWETVVVREDDWLALGDGVALVPEGSSEALVVNRTGRKLRAVMLKLPGRTGLRWLGSLEDGASARSAGFSVLAGGPSVRATAGGLPIRWFDTTFVRDELERSSVGLGDAWQALAELTTDEADWFPDDVPVLLAQVDGGEGRTRDSGLVLDSDRLLVRVVGWGGTP